MAVLRRRMKGDPEPGGVLRLTRNCPLGSRLPALWEFLTLTTWDDGTARETGAITLFLQDGLLKACLNDKDGHVVAFVSAEGLEALLEAMNRGLSEDVLDWRRARENGGGRAKR